MLRGGDLDGVLRLVPSPNPLPHAGEGFFGGYGLVLASSGRADIFSNQAASLG